jgi:uncharacterized protein YihD (DUF1040 family)
MSDTPKPPKYSQSELDEKVKQLAVYKQLHQQIAQELGMENRMNVLLAALMIEHLLGQFVEKLGLEREKKGFMSFETKIKKLNHLVIDDDEKILLDTFRWTRNRFIHDLEVTSFTNCYAEESGYKERVLEFAEYEIERAPEEMKWNEEMKLNMGFNLLCKRISAITERIINELGSSVPSSINGGTTI